MINAINIIVVLRKHIVNTIPETINRECKLARLYAGTKPGYIKKHGRKHSIKIIYIFISLYA